MLIYFTWWFLYISSYSFTDIFYPLTTLICRKVLSFSMSRLTIYPAIPCIILCTRPSSLCQRSWTLVSIITWPWLKSGVSWPDLWPTRLCCHLIARHTSVIFKILSLHWRLNSQIRCGRRESHLVSLGEGWGREEKSFQNRPKGAPIKHQFLCF